MPCPPNKLKIVFVTSAAGRGGTTLVSRLLGEIEGCVNVGETQYLFDTRTRFKNAPCGCGRQVMDCSFWKGIEESVPDMVQEYAGHWVRTRRSPMLLLGHRRGPLSAGFSEFLSTLETTYAEIACRAGCGVIVTTTKSPWYLFALTRLPGIEVYVVHLVRSPEEVMASWSKMKNYTPARAALKILAEWSLYNILFEWFGGRARRYWRLRLEGFLGMPQEVLQPIANEIFERPVTLPFTGPDRARVHPQHILVGNPDKLTAGEIVIRGATRNSVSFWKKIFIRSLVFPLLWRYGYLGREQSARLSARQVEPRQQGDVFAGLPETRSSKPHNECDQRCCSMKEEGRL